MLIFIGCIRRGQLGHHLNLESGWRSISVDESRYVVVLPNLQSYPKLLTTGKQGNTATSRWMTVPEKGRFIRISSFS